MYYSENIIEHNKCDIESNEDVVNLEFNSINESFIKKYSRYSDKLKDAKLIEKSNVEQEKKEKRKKFLELIRKKNHISIISFINI